MFCSAEHVQYNMAEHVQSIEIYKFKQLLYHDIPARCDIILPIKEADLLKHKYSFFCDAANIDSSGKVSALGIFTSINTTKLPVTHTSMTFVACIEGRSSEAGRHPFRINFIDDDGKDVIPPMQGELEVTQATLNAILILSLNSVTFPQPGTYSMDLVVDNQVLASENLAVILYK